MARKITVTKTGTWYHGVTGRKKIGPGNGNLRDILGKSTYKPPRKKRNQGSVSLFSWLTGIPDTPVKKTRPRTSRTTSLSSPYTTVRSSASGAFSSSNSRTSSNQSKKGENGCVYAILYFIMIFSAIGWCITAPAANHEFFAGGFWLSLLMLFVVGLVCANSKADDSIAMGMCLPLAAFVLICAIGWFCTIFTSGSSHNDRHHRRRYRRTELYAPRHNETDNRNIVLLTEYLS